MFKIGHRGVMGYEPENTLLSFKKAIELGVNMIELDVHKCKSGEIVVIHDNKINGLGYIKDLTYEDLYKLDAGKGQKIPKLEEVFDLVNKRVEINIELKEEGIAFDVAKIIKRFVEEKNWNYENFLISSFNQYELLNFHQALPMVRIGVLFIGIPIDYALFAEKLNAYSLNLSKDFINKKFVEDAHHRGKKVFVFTINNKDDLKRVTNLGVDGIFSDYPDIL